MGSQSTGQLPIGAERSKPSNQQSVQVDVHVDGQGASQGAWESASRRSSQLGDDEIQEDVAVSEVAPEVVRQLARSLIQLSGIQPGQLLEVDHGSRHRGRGQCLSTDESPHQQGDHDDAGEYSADVGLPSRKATEEDIRRSTGSRTDAATEDPGEFPSPRSMTTTRKVRGSEVKVAA